MGTIAFSEKEELWILSYEDGVNCPFPGGRRIRAGTLDCVNCPSFVSVDRDRNEHATVLKCHGRPVKGASRTVLERG